MRGVFPFVDSCGIPLDIVIDRLKDSGMVPDWVEFYDEAVKAGWHPGRVVLRLSEAVGDVYGPTYREGWEKRFNKALASRRTS